MNALLVIFSKNPIYSVLFLVLLFVNASVFLFLLGIDFLAILFIVIYIGAIAVLFLFMVMMMDIGSMVVKESLFRYFPVGFFIIVFFIFEVSFLFLNNRYLLVSYNELIFIDWYHFFFFSNVIHGIAEVLFYTSYIYFIICAFILLISMIGVVLLTYNLDYNDKGQDADFQVFTSDNTKLFLYN